MGPRLSGQRDSRAQASRRDGRAHGAHLAAGARRADREARCGRRAGRTGERCRRDPQRSARARAAPGRQFRLPRRRRIQGARHSLQIPRLGQPGDRRAADARPAHRCAARRARALARAHRRAAREARDMMIEYVLAGGVATVALNRPEVRNAVNLEMCEALLAAAERAKADDARLVFVRGRGPVFCGGADLNERKGKSEQWVRERRLKAFAAYEALEALPMPCIALVHGAAIGSGVEIAGACGFAVATPGATLRTPEASFRTPEAQRGSVGATQRLPRILGKRLAKDLMFTGRALTAEEAREAGFVARIVADLDAAAAEIAIAITKAPPLALRLAKRAVNQGVELDPQGARQVEIAAIEEQLASGQWMGKT